MTRYRLRLPQLTAVGLVLSQTLGLGLQGTSAFAQNLVTVTSGLPKPISTQSLTGLEVPPDMVVAPKEAVTSAPTASNITGSNERTSNPSQLTDLIQLYQDAAFSDPVLNSARFQYQANKELFWQGFSLLLPQASVVPIGTRYYQHAVNNSALQTFTGNSRVFDQKSYTLTLTQPVFNLAALEAFKQGDLGTKIADLQFYQAQQDLILRVSPAYFDVLTSQDNVDLFKNKKGLIKQQLDIAQAKFEAGLATIVDVNTAQAAHDLANSQEIGAQADLIVKRGVLEVLVGHPVSALKPLMKDAKIDGVVRDPRSKSKDANGYPIAESVNPKLPPGQTLDDWIKQAEAANFGVLAGQLTAERSESLYRGALALNYPSLSFVGTSGYNTSSGTPNSFTPAQTNVYNNTVALQMNIPLVSGGYNNSVIRQNAALVDKAKSDYDLLRRTAAQNTRQAFTGFYGGLASVKAYEAAEKSSSLALQSSKLGFEVGTLINIDVLIALDTLITTRSQLYQARYNTILNALKLKAQASSLSDEDLLSINSLLR